MKKVAIVGLGQLSMLLVMSLAARGWQVAGSETTLDGVEAARMSDIENYSLRLEPGLVCKASDLGALMGANVLVIMLPARRSGPGEALYLQAMQELMDNTLAYRIPRIVSTSSASVYGDVRGTVKEGTARNPVTASDRVLKELGDWLHNSPGAPVGILRLTKLIGLEGHPGRFFAGRTAPNGHHGVSLVHLDDVVSVIMLLL